MKKKEPKVKDLSDNAFAGIISPDKTTWNFTSADVIAPTLTALSPTDNSIDRSVQPGWR